MKWRQVGILAFQLAVSYVLSVLVIVIVIVTLPVGSWVSGRAFRLVGLGFSVGGAMLSLIPRALRTREEIEAQAGTYWGSNPHLKKDFLRDTTIAKYGMILLAVGFIQQLVGNILG